MVFNSLHFLWFFIVVYGLYRVLPHRAQNWLLLAASYYFYAAWDWRFLGLLLASTAVDYSCGRLIDGERRPAAPEMAALPEPRLQPHAARVLQVLQLLRRQPARHVRGGRLAAGFRDAARAAADRHLVLHVRHDELRDRRLPARDSGRRATSWTSRVFVAYFPHLVAGPILRASRLLPQIHNPRTVTPEQMRDGAWLVAWGFFQKVFVADNLAGVANAVFDPGTHAHRDQRPARRLRVRVPDLRRLRRLLEHRARHLEADGHRAAGEFPLPLFRALAAGVLAPLAHQPVDLAARLPLHPARRQPRHRRGRRTATCSSRWCSAGCGTARRGRSCSGASITGCC